MPDKFKPGEWGTRNGKPAITWWRHGIAALGEPSVVREVREYFDEKARQDAFDNSDRKMVSKLFHVTSTAAMPSIAKNGLRALSYWSNHESLVAYYKETVQDDGDEPIVLVIELDQLLQTAGSAALEPDFPGLEEPITSVIGKNENAVLREWDSSQKSWQDSLNVVGSLRCRTPIEASMLKLLDKKTKLVIDFLVHEAPTAGPVDQGGTVMAHSPGATTSEQIAAVEALDTARKMGNRQTKVVLPLQALFDSAPASRLGMLPPEATFATVEYCIKADDMPESLDSIKVFKDVPATLLEIPVEVIKAEFMAWPDMSSHGSFENYHRWYMRGGDVPVYSAEHRWPCIASLQPDEVVQDGNHRLHAYINAGHGTIPVLRYECEAWWKAHECWKQSMESQHLRAAMPV